MYLKRIAKWWGLRRCLRRNAGRIFGLILMRRCLSFRGSFWRRVRLSHRHSIWLVHWDRTRRGHRLGFSWRRSWDSIFWCRFWGCWRFGRAFQWGMSLHNLLWSHQRTRDRGIMLSMSDCWRRRIDWERMGIFLRIFVVRDRKRSWWGSWDKLN
jgi:hypothetical protein